MDPLSRKSLSCRGGGRGRRADGRQIDPQILHHITPMGFEGINLETLIS